jgi:outer membrane lipoprotein carrier protein
LGLRADARVVVLLLCGGAAAVSADTAEDWARRVEERHRKATDLTAHFTQSYRSGLIGREIVETGTLALKPPGRMRWEYRDPEKKTFVSDGKTFYFYVPADRQVIVRPTADQRSLPALLLSGQGEILSHFKVSLEPSADDSIRLRLVPRKADAEIEHAVLVIDGRAVIRSLEIADAQGNRSRFEFKNLRENQGLPDETFRFEPPKGVEVITG